MPPSFTRAAFSASQAPAFFRRISGAASRSIIPFSDGLVPRISSSTRPSRRGERSPSFSRMVRSVISIAITEPAR